MINTVEITGGVSEGKPMPNNTNPVNLINETPKENKPPSGVSDPERLPDMFVRLPVMLASLGITPAPIV